MLNSKFDLYKREWLDLVFTGRNKSYGAYELRAHAGQYALRAMALTLGVFIAGAVAIKLFMPSQDQRVWLPPTEVDLHDLPHVIPPPAKKIDQTIHNAIKQQPAQPKVHTPQQAFAVPQVTNQPVPDEKITPQTQLVNPGLENSKGDELKQTTIVDSEPGTADKPGGEEPATDSRTIFDGVEVMPEPNGGMAAWAKFLQRNIRYPDTEAEGKVYLSFVIEVDGKLSNITLLKGVDKLLDDEALRVLKLAPAWKPGIQNGHAVRVRYTLPIAFQTNQ